MKLSQKWHEGQRGRCIFPGRRLETSFLEQRSDPQLLFGRKHRLLNSEVCLAELSMIEVSQLGSLVLYLRGQVPTHNERSQTRVNRIIRPPVWSTAELSFSLRALLASANEPQDLYANGMLIRVALVANSG